MGISTNPGVTVTTILANARIAKEPIEAIELIKPLKRSWLISSLQAMLREGLEKK
jgi:hypothetical protein